jgi:regulator of replication initiation timing
MEVSKMAHVQKFTKAAAGHMFKHFERAKNEQGEYIKFANQSIDLSKSELNYNLAPERNISQGDFIKKRCTEDGVRCMNRKDVNVMCSWIVTAPQKLPEENHKQFFEEAYKFLSNRYGEENVVSAYVHNDETQPHIHFAFVPVVADKKRGGYKVSAKELVNKSDLLRFHPDLSKHMISVFGYDIGVENGATALGNQTVEQLKAGEELKKDLNEKIENLNQQVEFVQDHVASLDKEVDEKSVVVEDLESKQIALESEINQQTQQIESDKAELEKISKKKADVKAVENIEVKHTLFGDKLTVSADDFENLKVLAKKQAASVKSTKQLKSQVAELTQENQALTAENKDLKAKSGNSIQLRLENDRLKKQVSSLQNSLDWVMKFIEKFNLEERLEAFLSQFRERGNNRKYRQEI